MYGCVIALAIGYIVTLSLYMYMFYVNVLVWPFLFACNERQMGKSV